MKEGATAATLGWKLKPEFDRGLRGRIRCCRVQVRLWALKKTVSVRIIACNAIKECIFAVGLSLRVRAVMPDQIDLRSELEGKGLI